MVVKVFAKHDPSLHLKSHESKLHGIYTPHSPRSGVSITVIVFYLHCRYQGQATWSRQCTPFPKVLGKYYFPVPTVEATRVLSSLNVLRRRTKLLTLSGSSFISISTIESGIREVYTTVACTLLYVRMMSNHVDWLIAKGIIMTLSDTQCVHEPLCYTSCVVFLSSEARVHF